MRYNGGGFVDQLIFERLRRILVGMDSARNWESSTVPPVVFHGYMAAITNQYAASDGDIFSEFFKVYKLGPLIGERTWGGVRGIRGDFALIDGGYITRPEFADYGLNSKWVVENHGVAPDIEVDDRPDDVVHGKDAQLDRAIQEVMKRIEANPKKLPPAPARSAGVSGRAGDVVRVCMEPRRRAARPALRGLQCPDFRATPMARSGFDRGGYCWLL